MFPIQLPIILSDCTQQSGMTEFRLLKRDLDLGVVGVLSYMIKEVLVPPLQ